MQKDSRLFDDMAKAASGALGTFLDLRREIEGLVTDKTEKLLSRMNLVRREEFELVRQMAEKARAEQEKLTQKLAELEKVLELKETKPTSSK